MEAYGWRRHETTGEAALRGWVVAEAIEMKPRPSPPMRRVTRSLFILDADVKQLLTAQDDDDDDVEVEVEEGVEYDEEYEDAGRLDDEGADDRPWH